MSLLIRLADIWGRLRRRPKNVELDEEIEAHLDLEINENIAAGMPPEEARCAARRKFGNVALFREMTSEVWRFGWFDRLCQDVRFAGRALARSRTFTLAAISTLAIGIGATVAIFTVVYSALFPVYSFRNPDRIMHISAFYLKDARDAGRAPSLASFMDWRRNNEALEFITAFRHRALAWMDGGEPARIMGLAATSDIFRMAGIHPMLGRDFEPDADLPGKGKVVILGFEFWQERYRGDRNIVGKHVSIENEPYTVIGVLAPREGFPSSDIRYWIPWQIAENPLDTMPGGGFSCAGLLKGNLSLLQAEEAMNLMEARLARNSDRIRQKFGVALKAWPEFASRRFNRTVMWTLFGAVFFVLLVACTNVANLHLARAAVRARETALRAALGASRARIVRYLLTESALLSMIGGAGGILLAYWGIRLFVYLKPSGIPGPGEAQLNFGILFFAVGASTLTALLFGLLPALTASKQDLVSSLKEGLTATASSSIRRKRAVLVVCEIAIALVLLIGAGLMIRSFVALINVELGFDPKNILAFRVAPPKTAPEVSAVQRRDRYFADLLNRLRALPSVQAVAASSIFPLDGSAAFTSASTDDGSANPDWRAVEPIGSTHGYFETLRIPLLRGRAFAEQDDSGNAPIVILSREAAGKFFPRRNPIGKRLRIRTEKFSREVVGVVGDVRYQTLQTQYGPKVYVPAGSEWMMGYVAFVVRTDRNPGFLAPALKREVWALDPRSPVEIQSIETLYEPHIATPRFYLGLFGFFACIAVAMAAIGLYGLINYSVTRRTHEIGVRMAVGAQAADVIGMVLRNAVLLALAGITLGVAGALWLTRFLKVFLFEVASTDVLTYFVVSAVLLVVALLASLGPARRAAGVDPSVALKNE